MNNGTAIFFSTLITTIISLTNKIKLDYEPKLQPKNALFSLMWITIFTAFFVSAVARIFDEELISSRETVLYEVFTSLSLILCGIWVILSNTISAVYIIHAAMISALASTFFAKDNWKNIPNGLICGWLILASTLNVTIHMKKYHDKPDLLYQNIVHIIIFSILVCTHILFKRFITATSISIPFLLATFFSKSFSNTIVLLAPQLVNLGFLTGFMSVC